MQHWYVYYKLAAAEAAPVAARVQRMIERLPADGPRGRLLRRVEGGDEITLMEVYEPIADVAGFEAALARALSESGLPSELLARRRTERFEDF